jgi:hypothetical protein
MGLFVITFPKLLSGAIRITERTERVRVLSLMIFTDFMDAVIAMLIMMGAMFLKKPLGIIQVLIQNRKESIGFTAQ